RSGIILAATGTRAWRAIGKRHRLQQRPADRVDPGFRDAFAVSEQDLASVGVAGSFIDDRTVLIVEERRDTVKDRLGEIPTPFRLGRHRSYLESAGRPAAGTLIVKGEEGPVSPLVQSRDPDRTADIATEDVLGEMDLSATLRVLKPRIGVKNVVLHVLEELTVKLVGAALGHELDGAARKPAILG